MRRGITALVGCVVLALLLLYSGSALLISRSVAVDLPAINALDDPASIAEGARLAAITGCTRCHGDQAQGRLMTGIPHIGRIVAPSLPQIAAQATDGQLARAIRNGVGTNARPLFIMPADAYNHLSADDVARLIGWMRSVPTSAFDVVGTTSVGPRGRFAILTRRLPDSVALGGGQPKTRPADMGRYLAQVSCGQCHALDRDQRSVADGSVAPALARAAAAYDPVRLRDMLRTGLAPGGRILPVMSRASQSGLRMLNDGEIDAIRTYLIGTVAGKAGR